MKNKKSHSTLCGDILLEIQNAFPKGRFFLRPVARAKLQSGKWITAGIAGQADLYGFIKLTPHALHVEIEVKTKGDYLKPNQKSWRIICNTLNVCYVVGRAPDQTVREIRRFLSENASPKQRS